MRRNSCNDSSTEDANYTGFDFYWEDGQPAQVNLACLCGIGVSLVFGEDVPSEGLYRVQFYLVPVDNPYGPRLAVPRKLKPRRIYFERQGPAAILHLANGFPTDVSFGDDDDPRVIRWVGSSDLMHGQRQWMDLLALFDGVVEPTPVMSDSVDSVL